MGDLNEDGRVMLETYRKDKGSEDIRSGFNGFKMWSYSWFVMIIVIY
jgi:hypothetical protein